MGSTYLKRKASTLSKFLFTNWRYGVVSAALCLLFYFYLATLQFLTTPEVVKRGAIVSGVVEKEELTKEERIAACKKNKECRLLAEVGYFEARNQKTKAAAVGPMFVALNRKEADGWANTLRGVVYQKWQFSYTHDGSLQRGFKEKSAYERMLYLAHKVYSGDVKDPTNGALWYHTHQVSPGWSKKLKHVVTLGDHKFYKRVKNES